MTQIEKDNLVKESIRECLKINPQFKPTDTLVITTYSILKNIFVDEIKYIFLEAPTGSGKSVIGYMVHFCYCYVTNKIAEIDPIVNGASVNNPRNTYLLTSSKVLQQQLESDITRFNLDDYLVMIKGVKNYECLKQTKDTGIYHNYSERFCGGMKTSEKEQLECYNVCPYIQKRFEASIKDCTILNYSYFLNALKNPFNAFFGTRQLTIADEAHLIPDIVLGMYNIDLTLYRVNKLLKICNQIALNFNKSLGNEIYELRTELGNAHKIFLNPNPTLKDFIEYQAYYGNIIKALNDINNKMALDVVFQEMFKKDFVKIFDDFKSMDYDEYFESLTKREKDVFIKSESIGNQVIDGVNNIAVGSYKLFKHNLYDLSESELCRKHFISKVDTCVFMSATLGNIEEFAELMGLKKGEYNGFRLESNFNFDESPIYLCKSGYLNYNNFQKNIDKVLLDTLRICEHYHPKEKGIIHTSTFAIANSLKDKVWSKQGGVTNPKRYLFYSTPEEKEACIELMKANTNIPYIIIGPSLYEGIDLKDEQGRFNIIVKIPYSGIDDYIRKKMEIYEFWYNRQTLEKLVQSIGRTNRHINDWSKTYIMDSGVEKIVYGMPPFMTKRLQYLTIR